MVNSDDLIKENTEVHNWKLSQNSSELVATFHPQLHAPSYTADGTCLVVFFKLNNHLMFSVFQVISEKHFPFVRLSDFFIIRIFSFDSQKNCPNVNYFSMFLFKLLV